MNQINHQLWFTGQCEVDVREGALPTPKEGEVLVKTLCSAISAGTEMLVYRGQLPADVMQDASIESLQQTQYPLQYGYASVGKVIAVGSGVDQGWLDKKIFAFQPHASFFVGKPESFIEVPGDVTPEDAVFLANMETAVNLVQDGKPILGERVVVLGQGIVGLLLTSLLVQMPFTEILVGDKFLRRLELAHSLGAQVFDPSAAAADEVARMAQQQGADLIFELTGAPEALNLAVELSGYHSRIVIGSWYGTKSAPVHLGGTAHRNRLQISTSQVSSIAPELSGRWNKSRRFDVAWNMIRRVRPSQFITHSASITDAAQVYQQIDQQPESLVQALLVY